MKRILITGASGFIGQHCLPLLLDRGFEVHAVSSKSISVVSAGVRWHEANLLDPEAIRTLAASVQPTHLLHLAWHTVHGELYTSLENFRWVQASLNLLQEFANQNGRRVVVAGSCAEYDWKYGYCSEGTTPLTPTSVYGTCKGALQRMFSEFSRHTHLSGAWARIFFLYGPHEYPQRLVASVICSILHSQPAQCSHGRQIRDYMYVRDAADAIVTLLESDVSGPVNIASGSAIQLKDLVDSIAHKLDGRDLVQLGALPTSEDEPPLLLADTRRLFDELNWRPHYDLEEALDQTVRWWKAQFALPNHVPVLQAVESHARESP